MIYILDNKFQKIVTEISKKYLYSAEHTRTKEEDVETFDGSAHVKYGEYLKDRNRILIPDKDAYREFIITHTEQELDEVRFECNASYLELLKTARPIPPKKLDNVTLQEAMDFVLQGTPFEPGIIEYHGEADVTWTDYNSPYDVLKIICTAFKVTFHARVDVGKHQVESRYIDMTKPEPLFYGKEVVRGKDLQGLVRTEDMSEVVTALYCIGPEREDGTHITTMVYDDEAQDRWGLESQYIWGLYSPETEDQNMTLERLTTLGKMELNKRNNSVVSYDISQLNLEHYNTHERIDFGAKIRIKDPEFKPPLYAESEVISHVRDLINPSNSTYVIGSIKEMNVLELKQRFAFIFNEVNRKLNDNFNNLNTIIKTTDEKLEIYERKVIKSDTAPLNPINDMYWYDTSNPNAAVLKRYFDGQWIEVKQEEREQMSGLTREIALYRSLITSFENLGIQHQKIISEVLEVTNSEYLVDDLLRAEVNSKANTLSNTYNTIDNKLKAITESTASLIYMTDIIKLFNTYRSQMQSLYTSLERAKIALNNRLKTLQQQYSDEKFNDAMNRVATAINGTWNAETGQLVADIPNEERLTELRQQIESTYNQELNSTMATLRNETDSKLVNTKNEISATVAKVDEKITGLTIGGRNLFINSGDLNTFVKLYGVTATRTLESTLMSRTGNLMHVLNIVRTQGNYVIYFPLKDMAPLFGTDNEVHTLSFYLKTNSPQAVSFVANGVSIVEQPNITVDNTSFKRVTVKFKAVTLRDTANNYNSHIVLSGSGLTDLWLYDLKLEKGTKATDWTPAPEDLQNEIATAQANAEAASKAYADAQDALRKTEVEAYADGIVTAEEERAINDAKAKLQEAKTYAEQQKQIAIDTANENTTSSLEPITVKTTNNEQSIKALEKQILLTATKEEVTQQLDSELTPIKTDVNDQKAQLQVMSDEISTKVSMNQYSLDQTSIVEQINKAETERTQLSNQINDRVTITEYNSGMEEKTNEINTAVNNIKIGGVNMLDGTKDFTSPFNTPNIQKYGEVINGELTSVDYDSVNNRLMWATFYTNIAVQPNTEYTISYDAKTKDGIAQGIAYTPITRLQDDGSTFNPQQYIATTTTYKNTTNDFQRYSFTFNTGASKRIKINFTSKDVNSLTNIKKVKLELGNKATPYEQSPNDVTNLITKARTDAEVAAKAYADAQDKLRKTEAQAYADGIVDAEEQRAINDAQQKLAEAKADAQAKADTAESLAREHADTQSAVAEQSAKAYADAQDELKQAEVKAYADGIVTEEEQRAITDAQQKLAEAKADAETKANNAEVSAKAYADGLKQQTDQTLTTYDTRITQNGQEISQRATKEEFNKTRGTLDKTLAQILINSHSGISLTYDDNGYTSDIIVDPQGIALNSSLININQGDVVIQNGVTTITNLVADKIKSGVLSNMDSSIQWDLSKRALSFYDQSVTNYYDRGAIQFNRGTSAVNILSTADSGGNIVLNIGGNSTGNTDPNSGGYVGLSIYSKANAVRYVGSRHIFTQGGGATGTVGFMVDNSNFTSSAPSIMLKPYWEGGTLPNYYVGYNDAPITGVYTKQIFGLGQINNNIKFWDINNGAGFAITNGDGWGIMCTDGVYSYNATTKKAYSNLNNLTKLT